MDSAYRRVPRLAAPPSAAFAAPLAPPPVPPVTFALRVTDSDVVYADTFISMGEEAEKERRLKAFDGFQIDMELFSKAKEDAIFMHCLPAHRGEEVTDEVIDCPRSVLFQEAENRMHGQKAIMVRLADLR